MSEMENNNNTTATTEPEVEIQPTVDSVILEEMVKAGVLFGRSKSKTNPRMKKYIETIRNGIEVFDPSTVLESIEKAAAFLSETAKKSGSVLFVGTLPASQELVKNMAEKFSFPYVTRRWLGGTLTNYKTISQRLQYYINLKADQAAGRLEKYTKKERLMFDKDIQKMTELFGGLEKLSKMADVLVVVDAREHEIAVREAQRLNMPIIALINSNNDPENISYPIPCNSSSKLSVEWVLKKLEEAIQKGVEERKALGTSQQVTESK